MQIPKIIHQVWEGKKEPLPDFLRKLGDTWRSNHPDWEYVYWDKERMEVFVQKNFLLIGRLTIISLMMLCVGM